MNAVTKTNGNPADALRQQLTRMGPELKNALPSQIKPERFQRVVMTVAQQQPDLLLADRRSLLTACLKCAADGLVPDGREAALVVFNTKVKDSEGREKWIKAVQYLPMMFGILKRIRNSGEVASVQAHVIYQNDQFLLRRGLEDTLEHTPLFPGDRGAPIGAYAVAKFKDGSGPVFETMDIEQIEKVRAVSKNKDGPVWKNNWDEMARKTVFRRLSKWLPMDAETEALMRRDDEIGTVQEPSGVIDGIADEPNGMPQLSHESKLDALEGEVVDHAQAELSA
jgi:recombination protein RecT